MVVGVPVESPAYVTHKLREQAGVIMADARRIALVLRPNRQQITHLIRPRSDDDIYS